MKEYKCDKCSKPCILQVEDNADYPMWCPYSDNRKVCNWHEVKEETCTPTCTKLPDWAKVGELVYDIEKKQYQTISLINGTVICNNIDGDGCTQYGYGAFISECVQARKRPFNADEMKALVGKVFTTPDGDVSIATDFDNIMDSICICSEWFKNKELANSVWQLDGKPCYVLEHRNDKGE